MNSTIDRVEGRVPVTVLRLEGDLDASNYEAIIEQGRELYADGTRYLLLDMRNVPYMGSSGLVAIHSLAVLLAGGEPASSEEGWGAYHAIEGSVESGLQPHVKVLLGDPPSPGLMRVFERTGMNRFIEVHTNEAEAIASF
jgi:anti-anti-sigma regulatory factor